MYHSPSKTVSSNLKKLIRKERRRGGEGSEGRRGRAVQCHLTNFFPSPDSKVMGGSCKVKGKENEGKGRKGWKGHLALHSFLCIR